MRCVKVTEIKWEGDFHDLEIEGGDGNYVVEGVVVHNSNMRFGFSGSRPFMIGTHTSRVVDSRLTSSSWPNGHIVRKMIEWCEHINTQTRVELWRNRNPEVKSLAVFGEVCGYKCSDLHYGRTAADGDVASEVLLFGEVAIDGRFLDYDDALEVLGSLFPDKALGDLMVPVLYRGKPERSLLKQLRDRPSALAEKRGAAHVSEGIVIRPTKEALSVVALNRLIAKYKSPLYEERKSLQAVDVEDLPRYVNAYDLISDFVTDERIRHVLAKAEASGIKVEKRRIKELAGLLYEDIRKESVGEWPAGDVGDGTLRRWTFAIAGEALSSLINTWTSQERS